MNQNRAIMLKWLTLSLIPSFCVGCSGSKSSSSTTPAKTGPASTEPSRPADTPAETKPDRGESRPKEDVEISGLAGTIDEEAVSRAVKRKSYEIESCVLTHARPMTYVTGDMQFKFEVAVDGSVKVVLLKNNVGNYQVEECILAVVRGLRFGKPKGGKVVVNYPLSLPHRGTTHVVWGKVRVRSAIRSKDRAIRACRQSGHPRKFTLNFYVLPGGRVVSLGVFSAKGVPSGFAACVLNAVKDVSFPDTLGKVAKVEYSY